MKYSVGSDKFNPTRKILLQEIEKGRADELENDLFFYGLTSYIKNENETLFSSLTSKLFYFQNELKTIKHISDSKKKFFMKEQINALHFLEQNNRAIISAPTSFGKTLIVKEYIFLHKPNVVVFIVPTNALAYELETSFKENPKFEEEYEIFDKSFDKVSVNSKKILFIGTQEKYLEVADLFANIDLLVIDEAYKLKEKCTGQRGYRLSKSFYDGIQRKTTKIILLTPIANLIGFDDFEVFETKFNAVDKSFHVIPDVDHFYNELNKKSINEKTILYCSSPESINSVYERIEPRFNPNDNLLKHLNEDFHPDWNVTKMYSIGVVCHHGQMPKYLQNKMINIFLYRDNFKLLVGTNSISEGINTPTKNLFINKGTRKSDRLLIKNTFGRAGRLGVYPLGHIYSTNEMESIDKESIDIELALSNAEEQAILLDTDDESKIISFCSNYGINEKIYKKLIDENHVSQSLLGKILDGLKNNCSSNSYVNAVSISYTILKEADVNHKAPFYLTVAKIFAKIIVGNNTVRSIKDKIIYFRNNYHGENEYTNSEIIDLYMKFMYQTLEYDIMTIVRIGLSLHEEAPDWCFGLNVFESLKDFYNRYVVNVLGITSETELGEEEMKVVASLREYGIDMVEANINLEIVNEIKSQLNVRFSMFDIVNAIRTLSQTSGKNTFLYQQLLDKYFSY